MRVGEIGVAIHHLRSRFADDDKTHDDGLLRALVLKELAFSMPVTKPHASLQPAACGRGNRAIGSQSYGLRLRKHFGSELRRQIYQSLQVDMKVQQRFQFVLQATQVK